MSHRLPAFAAWNRRILQPSPETPRPTSSRAAHPGSPLTTGVLPENLRSLDVGSGLGVQLWNQWPAMLAGLPAIGEVLAITCNECAVLGKYVTFPRLAIDSVREIATDPEGEFEFALSSWHTARALHLRAMHGHQYGIEFRGADGQTLHKVCLTADSSLDAFVEWVQIHQATPEDMPSLWRRPSFDETPADNAASISPEDHLQVDPARLREWLHAAAGQRLPIHAMVGNDGCVQSHCFVPCSVREREPWLFCSSDEVGLHLDPARMNHLVLHNIAPDETPCWTFKAYGPMGRLNLALAPTATSHRARWTELTRQIFPELQLR